MTESIEKVRTYGYEKKKSLEHDFICTFQIELGWVKVNASAASVAELNFHT